MLSYPYDPQTLASLISLLFLVYLTGAISNALKLGKVPSLVRVGYTSVGPDILRSQSPRLFLMSLGVMISVWLAVTGALLKSWLWPLS